MEFFFKESGSSFTNKIPKLTKGNAPIILVDDDQDHRHIAKICFNRAEKKNPLILLENGAELIEYMKAVLNKTETLPELILLDINMYGLNGRQTLAVIRGMKEFKKLPPIVMLSVSNSKDDVIECSKLGADGYKEKPMIHTEFIQFFKNI